MKRIGLNALPIINIGLTTVIGILVLASESISNVDYIFMWSLLVVHEVVVFFIAEAEK